MKTIDLDSWSDFPSAIVRVREELNASPRAGMVLFRGQADSEWDLTTTLERRSADSFSVHTYSELALRWAHELRSVTGHQWETLKYPDLCEWLEKNVHESHAKLPCYSYMIYLRHHGFASPLLDWTESPYVAAYFAFCEPLSIDGRAVVFVYAEAPQGLKGGVVGAPTIYVQGPFVDTHARHFSQQACYSLCTRWDGPDRGHIFHPHSEVFRDAKEDQDVLVKVTVPRSERRAALAFLKEANINHFTLFQTEDSLVKAMDIRAFDLENG